MAEEEIAPWLKSLPVAPEYRPTEVEFADPIGYILKIEKEASEYGICKIVPPLPKPSRKLVFANLNRTLIESQDAALAVHGSSSNSITVSRNMNTMQATSPASQLVSNIKGESFEEADLGDGDRKARFTTRLQQIGWNPRKFRGPVQSVVQKQVWESGESYTLDQFEAKARLFYRSRLGTCKEFSPLALETMFWKQAADKPITVEYANDIPGTAFGEPSESFTRPAPPQGRKRKFKPQAQVVIDKYGICGNMEETDRKDDTHTDSRKVSALNDEDTDDAPVVGFRSAEPCLSGDIAEAPMGLNIAPDKICDDLADGVKTRNKNMEGNADRDVGGAGWKLSNSPWNMRIVARSPGSLIRHMPDEVPGVTTPMVYLGMLFSWFAWHVEDHELHSLNYLHIGSPKTWYAVPGDAAASLEDVIRVHGYGEHLSPLAAFAILGEKTTLMSPEILIKTGIPCCRLVQNPGEFVVTFPRAYHLGFSHGFNCGEAANIATPSWLKVAKEAATRRAAMNYLPMLSHQQLLYMLSFSFPPWIPMSLAAEPRSSRLKDKKRSEGELAVKEFFVNDMIHNNHLLSVLLEKESTCYAVLWDSADVPSVPPSMPSSFSTTSHPNWRSASGVGSQETLQSAFVTERGMTVCKKEGLCAGGVLKMNKNLPDPMRMGVSSEKYEQKIPLHCTEERFMDIHVEGHSMGCQSLSRDSPSGDSMHLDTGTLACVACGILGFPCMAIIQPSEAAAKNLYHAGFEVFDKHLGAFEVGSMGKDVASTVAAVNDRQSTGPVDNCGVDFLLETPIALVSNCVNYQDQVGEGLCGEPSEVNTVGDCTASLVHAAILAPSTKDGKRDFQKIEIQQIETEPAVTPLTKGTEKDVILEENQMSKSALDLLAAMYNDESDSEEVDDDVELDESQPARVQSRVLSDNDNIAGVANSQPSSSGAIRTAIGEGSRDDFILGGVLPAETVSSVPTNHNHSHNDIDRDLHFKGSQFSSVQPSDLQKESILAPSLCKNSIKEIPVFKLQPTDHSENRSVGSEYAHAWASGFSEDRPNMIQFSIQGAENMETSGNACASYSQEASFIDHCGDGEIRDCAKGFAFEEKIPDMAVSNGGTVSLWKPCKGFMRPHVFCLDHALEVEEQLHSMGGAHLILLCHANYPKIEEQAKLRAKEIGIDNSWKNIPLRNAVENDLEMIAVAIEEETDAELGRDWTAQLGVNLRYSVKLSKSPLYTKAIPYNKVLDALFYSSTFDCPKLGKSYSCYPERSREDSKPKVSKHKKMTVAGKWCGKVWMVKQVHPYLAGLNVQQEPAFVNNQTECSEVSRSRGRPRKQTVPCLDSKNMSEESMEDTCDEQIFPPVTRNIRNPSVNRNFSRKKKFNMEELTYDSKMDSQLFEDRILDSLEQVRSADLSFKQVKSEDHSDKGKSGEVASERSDSHKQYEQFLPSTGSGAKSLLPSSSLNTSERKSRYKRKKPGWKHDVEDFLNTDEHIPGENNILGSEEHAVPGFEAPPSCDPHAYKDQVSLRFSSQSGNLPLGPRTRLRTRSMQANIPKIPTDVDKVSGKQSQPLSKKRSKGKRKVTKPALCNDTEDEGSYQCDIDGCIMSFHTKQELVMHKRNACTVKGCGKRFGSHKYLLQHRKVHLDDRPLKCPWKGCKMTFKWAWARTEHIRVHTGERPYVCPVAECGQTFRFVSDFSRHKRKTGHGKQ